MVGGSRKKKRKDEKRNKGRVSERERVSEGVVYENETSEEVGRKSIIDSDYFLLGL